MTAPEVPTGNGESLHERIVNDLGLAIVSGRYAPGDVLPHVDDLRATYGGAGRSTIREAVRVLSGKGLVFSRQRVGTMVAPRSEWNALDASVLGWSVAARGAADVWSDLMAVRRILEPEVAAEAAATATPADLARIRDAYDRMAATYPDVASVQPDLDFHHAIALAAHNDLLSHLVLMLMSPLRVAFEHTIELSPAPEISLARHRAILTAIEAGDPEGARAASVVHLASTEEVAH